MKTQTSRYLYNCLAILMGMFILLNVAQSATFNSGKTKKKSNHKSTALSFNLHNKSVHLMSTNGFTFKGGFHTLQKHKDNFDIQLKSAYFSKGNNIYVQPLKSRIIISRFKTPQKSLY